MNKPTHIKKYLTVILLLIPMLGFAQKWRLIARTSEFWRTPLFNSDNQKDSTYYIYMPQNDRDATFNSLDTFTYDRSDRYQRENGANAFKPYGEGERIYNTSGQLLSTKSTVFDPRYVSSFDTFTYNNGNLASRARYTGFNNISGTNIYALGLSAKYFYTYDAQNVMTEQEQIDYVRYDKPSYSYLHYYQYNTNGQLVQDSMMFKRFLPGWSMPMLSDIIDINYNANGDISEYIVYKRDTAWKKYLYTTRYYRYNASGQLIADSSVTGPNVFYEKLETTYTYNTQGQLIADTFRSTYYSYSRMDVSATVNTYSYTSFGALSERKVYDVDTLGYYKPRFEYKYYYSLYWPVGIGEVSADTKGITLYPNPAVNVLHIATSEAYTQGRIYNSMGQVVKLVNANSKQIDVTQLPAGNYNLQLSTNDKAVSKRFTIVR